MVEYTINPETGRRIQIGGDTYNRLIITSYDHINGELVRRESAPPPALRQYYLNTVTGRSILAGSRRYHELIRAGWEIEDDYYLVPPGESHAFQDAMAQTIATVQEAGQEIAQRRTRRNTRQEPATFENIMAVHGERLANLNITLCRECLYAIKPEDGEHCNDCRPE